MARAGRAVRHDRCIDDVGVSDARRFVREEATGGVLRNGENLLDSVDRTAWNASAPKARDPDIPRLSVEWNLEDRSQLIRVDDHEALPRAPTSVGTGRHASAR